MNPYKEQRVEDLHGSILFRMRVLGYDLDRKETTPVSVNTVFHTKKNGVRATGRYNRDTGRFTVLSGSEVDLGHAVIKNQGAVAARRQLFAAQTGQSDSCGTMSSCPVPPPPLYSFSAAAKTGGSNGSMSRGRPLIMCTEARSI
mgnify:CR=1 FL=1